MLEMLLNSAVVNKNILEIDFSKQSLGDKMIVDFSGNQVFTFASGTQGTVVSDATMGKVMQINGGLYTTATDQLVDLTKFDWDAEFIFKTANNSTLMTLWATGDFNGGRIYGVNLSVNYNGDSQHFWIDNGGYYRLICGRSDNTQWTTVVVKNRNNSQGRMTISSNPGNYNGSIWNVTFGKGQKMAIGGSYTGGTLNGFNGLIKSIKITRV